VMRHP